MVKHAKAQHASVSLRLVSGALQLEVHDDGVGFDTEAGYAGHLALRSMRERVERQRGEIRIESVPGSGPQVVVRVPV